MNYCCKAVERKCYLPNVQILKFDICNSVILKIFHVFKFQLFIQSQSSFNNENSWIYVTHGITYHFTKNGTSYIFT